MNNLKTQKTAKLNPAISKGNNPIFWVQAPILEVNWRKKGKVSPVRPTQGPCGSCWAFAAVAAIESAQRIRYNWSWDLSEQQLVDCTYSSSYNGCKGGWMHRAYNYVIASGGIHKESRYPYISGKTRKSGTCRDKKTGFKLKIKSYSGSKMYNCSSMKYKIQSGPGSAVVCVSMDFREYKSGIFNDYCGCTGKNLHAVLIYGYSRSGTWYIKNSWGKRWGWGGLMLMKGGNTCNICKYGAEVVKI